MHIQRLALENFRVYPELQIEFSPGLTIIVGPNASGKTSLLEAIHFLATSKSHRTSADRELVHFGSPHARLQGTFVSQNRELTISATIPARVSDRKPSSPSSKQMKLDGQSIDRIADLIGRVPVVMFSNDDLDIVRGAPGFRRRFLNIAVAQLRPRYYDDTRRYGRALQQRNELLKLVGDGQAEKAHLEPWTEQLAKAGAAITNDRGEFIQSLSDSAGQVHARLSGGEEDNAEHEEIVVQYKTNLADKSGTDLSEEAFMEILRERLSEDIRRGYTTIGPHRDDFEIQINGKDTRTFGSQGQQRTAALSLKLAQADVVMSWRGEPPLLLLDDCLSELDSARSRRILKLAEKRQGMIITSPVMTHALAEQPDARIYEVQDGSVTPAGD
ncbi:MAG: DNA replication/repair protein RecF [Armatimonadota bacterium]